MSSIKKRGKKYYLYWYDEEGVRHGIPISTDWQTAKEYQVEFDRKRYRQGVGLPRRDVHWRDYTVEYMRYSESNKRKQTQKIDRNAIRLFTEIINPQLLRNVNPQDFEKYKAERIKTVTPVTINIELRALKAIHYQLPYSI